MNSRALRRIGFVTGALTTSALVLAGCAGSSGGAATADPNEKVTLTVATFNDFGYTDELLAEYSKEHPNVTIVHNKAATSNDARANYFQKLGKTGLADIEAIEIDWMPEVMKYSDLLAPVPDSLKGRWLDWKEKGATDADGNLIGYGTDIGPEGVCYRSDLFAAAGLPTDREEVAKLLQGDWANYFKVGADYTAKTGKAFFDGRVDARAVHVRLGLEQLLLAVHRARPAEPDPAGGAVALAVELLRRLFDRARRRAAGDHPAADPVRLRRPTARQWHHARCGQGLTPDRPRKDHHE